jgi:CheY-like chemotaxis protein
MKRVLVAEDADGIRRLIRSLLERDDFKVVEARNGSEAIEMIRTNPFDVAVIDLMMPGVTGYRVIEVIKAEKPELPFVVVTAAGEVGIGVLDPSFTVVKKPFDPVKLLDAVRGVMITVQ